MLHRTKPTLPSATSLSCWVCCCPLCQPAQQILANLITQQKENLKDLSKKVSKWAFLSARTTSEWLCSSGSGPKMTGNWSHGSRGSAWSGKKRAWVQYADGQRLFVPQKLVFKIDPKLQDVKKNQPRILFYSFCSRSKYSEQLHLLVNVWYFSIDTSPMSGDITSAVAIRKRNRSIRESAKSVLESIPMIPIHVTEIKKLILKDNPSCPNLQER